MTLGRIGDIITNHGDITDFISITIIFIILPGTGLPGGIHGTTTATADTIHIITADTVITGDTGSQCIITADTATMATMIIMEETAGILQREVPN